MRRIASCIATFAALGLPPAAQAATVFQINGGGNGHGIGMSQYGAYGYALHGKTYAFILAHYYRGTSLATTNANQVVRVLLGVGSASFSGASAAGRQHLTPATTYSVTPQTDGSLVLSTSAGARVGRFSAPLRVTGPGPLTAGGYGRYRGALEFRAAGSAVQTVNAVALDDYVRGVIAEEMPASWPLAALETQAVAARTYALTSGVAGTSYQLYSDSRSQMYGGVHAETAATNAAVTATRGQIVTYQGAPATTYFFSSSGGHTENIENVFLGVPPEPWLEGVRDPYDGAGGDPYHRWSVRMTIASATIRLGSLVKGTLQGIRVTKRGVSPRVVRAVVVGSGGSTRVTGPQLQSAFGLLSTYMRFTAISMARDTRAQAGANAIGPALHAVASVTRPALVGDVFPLSRGGRVTLQRLARDHSWRTVGRTRVGARGAYRFAASTAGTYRVVYDGVAGPTVRLR